MFLQNLKSIALSVPQIIGVPHKFGQSLDTPSLPVRMPVWLLICVDIIGLNLYTMSTENTQSELYKYNKVQKQNYNLQMRRKQTIYKVKMQCRTQIQFPYRPTVFTQY